MDYNDPQVQISIIALALSVISIIINLYDKIIKNIPRLKVKIHITNQFEPPDIKNTLKEIVHLAVTNTGYVVRDIQAPIIKFYGFKYNGSREVSVSIPSERINFPREIQNGKVFSYPIPAKPIMRLVGDLKIENQKIRVIIFDTYNKKYYSNKLRISKIYEVIERNKSFE